MTNCLQKGNVKYVPNASNDGCVVGSCVTVCGRKEAGCVLDANNSEDVKCSLFGPDENLGNQEKAILQYVMSGNVVEKNGKLYAKAATGANPYGGCGNETLTEYAVDPNTGKCQRTFTSESFKFTGWGNESPGCKECKPLVCPAWAKKASDCINWEEGCERNEISTKGDIASWDVQCKTKYNPSNMPSKGLKWGNLQGTYLPLMRDYYYFPSIDFKQNTSPIQLAILDAKGNPSPLFDGQPFNSVSNVDKLQNVHVPVNGYIRLFITNKTKNRSCYTYGGGDYLEQFNGKPLQLYWNGNNWYFKDLTGGPDVRPEAVGHDHSTGRCFGGGFTNKN